MASDNSIRKAKGEFPNPVRADLFTKK